MVWVDIFKADAYEEALAAAVIPDEPRVRQFHDSERVVARTIAPILGLPSMHKVAEHAGSTVERLGSNLNADYLNGPPAAYDTVLFFDADAAWSDDIPTPLDWLTQLAPSIHVGLDPERSFWEFAFYDELEHRGEQLLRAPETDR